MRIAAKTSAVALATGLITAFVTSAAVAAAPKVPTFDGPPVTLANPQAKPFRIVYTGDGSGLLAGHGRASRRPRFGRLHWTAWNEIEGRAWGANWLDDCTPDCASGRFTPYPVNVKVFRPEVVYGYEVFTRMNVTYTRSVPSFVRKRTQTWRVKHSDGQFFWAFPT